MFEFNTIEEVVQDLREGRIIIMTDDPERENEGDLICAAEFATKYNVNFMATYAKGLICMPMSAAMCEKLGLPQMVEDNTDDQCHRFYCLHRSCGHHDGYFGCGTFLYRGQVCG